MKRSHQAGGHLAMSTDTFVCHNWMGVSLGARQWSPGCRRTSDCAWDAPTAKKYPAPESAVGRGTAAPAQGHLGGLEPSAPHARAGALHTVACSPLRSRQHPRCGSKEITVSHPQRWERCQRSTQEKPREPPGRMASPSSSWAQILGGGGQQEGQVPKHKGFRGPRARRHRPDHRRAAATASMGTAPQWLPAPRLGPPIPSRPHLPQKLTAPQICAHSPHHQQMVNRTQRHHRHLLHTLTTIPGPDTMSCTSHFIGQSVNKHLLGPNGFHMCRATQPKHSLSPSDQGPGDRHEDSLSALGAHGAKLGGGNSIGKVPGGNSQTSAVRGVWERGRGPWRRRERRGRRTGGQKGQVAPRAQ